MSETTVPVTTLTSPSASASSLKARGRGAGSPWARCRSCSGSYAFASALPKLIAHPVGRRGVRQARLGQHGDVPHRRAELAGGLALLVPLLSSVAAVALSALMVGAFIVNVTAIHGPYVATPLILILPLALIAWARRNHTTELVRWVRRRA